MAITLVTERKPLPFWPKQPGNGLLQGVIMNTFFFCLWMSDNIGTALGLLLNFLLIYSIVKTTTDKTRLTSYLFLTTAIFDILFSVVEALAQHQLLVKNGMFLVMPHGIESFLGQWSYPAVMGPHITLCIHSILVLPALCHYRYKLITSGNAVTSSLILRNVSCSVLISVLLGICLGIGVYQGGLRGYDYYFQFVSSEWIDEDGSTPFRYATDIRDWGTRTFFYAGFGISGVAVWLAGFYTVKAWKAVNTQHSSERTKELQRQFTKTLIAQTLNAAYFVIFPISLASIAIQFRLDGKMLGTAVMSPLSWLPAANAALTIYLIRAYRRYVLRLLGIHCYSSGGNGALAREWKCRSCSTVEDEGSGIQSSTTNKVEHETGS